MNGVGCTGYRPRHRESGEKGKKCIWSVLLRGQNTPATKLHSGTMLRKGVNPIAERRALHHHYLAGGDDGGNLVTFLCTSAYVQGEQKGIW